MSRKHKEEPYVGIDMGIDPGMSMLKPRKDSEWTCYMFGGKEGDGIAWIPTEGNVPNRFVRFMMKVCFGCTWVKCSSTS